MNNNVSIKGYIDVKVWDQEGKLKAHSLGKNLVTTEGDQYLVDRLSDTGLGTMSCMALGTTATAPAKAQTWVQGPFTANGGATVNSGGLDSGYPQTNSGTPANLQYKSTWGTGYGTNSNIVEVVLSNASPTTGGSEPTGQILSRGTFSGVNKGTGDTMAVTWDFVFLGS